MLSVKYNTAHNKHKLLQNNTLQRQRRYIMKKKLSIKTANRRDAQSIKHTIEVTGKSIKQKEGT